MNRATWTGKGIRLAIAVTSAIVFSGLAGAADCFRYVSFDGTTMKIDADCAEERGITPIFVREKPGGYDIVVPPIGVSSPYNRLPWAAVRWLSNDANLNGTRSVVEFARDVSASYPPTSTGSMSRIEYVNYSLASWLDTSGASASIAGLANDPNASLSFCQSNPRCQSCEYYYCYWDDSKPHKMCWCDLWGTNCCVMGFQIAQ